MSSWLAAQALSKQNEEMSYTNATRARQFKELVQQVVLLLPSGMRGLVTLLLPGRLIHAHAACTKRLKMWTRRVCRPASLSVQAIPDACVHHPC